MNLFFNNKVDEGDSEFRNYFDFSMNLSDARKDASKKFVWIKVTFNTPQKYAGTLGDKVVVKRQWNSTGQIPDEAWVVKGRDLIRRANLSPGQRTQLTRFLNDIDFTYIPAIKDRDSFANLIERMYGAISQNKRLIEKTSGFISAIGEEARSLTSNISTVLHGDAKLSPPTDMQRLFRNLDFSIGEGEHSLLWQKGDGIKARYIPEILRFINKSEGRKKLFIWGFEEPENSLDLEAASAEASRFFEFSKRDDTQIFITSHSPAFYLADLGVDDDSPIKRFFVTKQAADAAGYVRPDEAVRSIDTLEETEQVMEGAGLLQLPIVIKQISQLNSEISAERERLLKLSEEASAMREQLNNLDLPTLYVEGPHDQEILGKVLKEMNAAEDVNLFPLGGTPNTPHAVLKSLLENGGLNTNAPTFFLFDNDKAGRIAAKGISSVSDFSEPFEFSSNAWTWLLPVRKEYEDFLDRWQLAENSKFFPIEFMFPAGEAMSRYEEIIQTSGSELDFQIQGDIWKAIMNDQDRSYNMKNLERGNVDWFYSRGVHDDLKESFSNACLDLPMDHLKSTLERILSVLIAK